MNEIEQYISRVCRHVGGSVSLRRHIRQELLQHIQDLTDRYIAEGMSKQDAVRKAIEDFGEPYEVSEGLEAVHGHILLSLVLEKSLEWKEKTMKPVIVWNSLTYIILLMLLLVATISLAFPFVFLIPQVAGIFSQEGEILPHSLRVLIKWMDPLFRGSGFIALGLGLGLGVAWGIFEWKCRVEYKALIRFCAIGSLSLVMLMLSICVWVLTHLALASATMRMLHPK